LEPLADSADNRDPALRDLAASFVNTESFALHRPPRKDLVAIGEGHGRDILGQFLLWYRPIPMTKL
jgi:hypothetical protein